MTDTIADIIRRRTAELGGQRILADQLGVSQATMSRWISGDVIPDEKWGPVLAQAAGIETPVVLHAILEARKTRRAIQEATKRRDHDSEAIRELRDAIEHFTARLEAIEQRLQTVEQENR